MYLIIPASPVSHSCLVASGLMSRLKGDAQDEGVTPEYTKRVRSPRRVSPRWSLSIVVSQLELIQFWPSRLAGQLDSARSYFVIAHGKMAKGCWRRLIPIMEAEPEVRGASRSHLAEATRARDDGRFPFCILS